TRARLTLISPARKCLQSFRKSLSPNLKQDHSAGSDVGHAVPRGGARKEAAAASMWQRVSHGPMRAGGVARPGSNGDAPAQRRRHDWGGLRGRGEEGEGSHAARGGAPGLGAGRGAEKGGTSELVPGEGGAPVREAGPGLVGGGTWSLEEGRQREEGGASVLETKGAGAQAQGAGLQPESGVVPVQEKGSSSVGGGALGPGAELRPLKGGAREPSEGVMARGVHVGAASAVGGPGDALGRELPRERWCGWNELGGHPTPDQCGCPGDPRGLRAGAAPQVEAQDQPGACPLRTGVPQNHPVVMCGCHGAGPLQRPQKCGCAGREATGYGVSGAVQSGQRLCSQTGSGLCVKGRVGTEKWSWAPRGNDSLGVGKGEGPWLLWPPLTPSPRCWGPQASPLLTGLVSVAVEPGGGGGDRDEGIPRGRQGTMGWNPPGTYLCSMTCNPHPHLLDGRVLTVCLSALATPAGAEGKRKLQIGVKKRVDHCPIKSRKGDVLHMHYTGKLEDGTEFDSSLPQNQPFVFSLGTGQVIKGWDQGLLGMCEGEKRKLVIPSELGYGERGAPPKIPGGATLVFEVELLKIERRSEL
ncbi:Peptidyl-prolyl cis-trans isomerase FKBP2, partial [Galemys pyrenaicus]